jgi:hypothetical protein
MLVVTHALHGFGRDSGEQAYGLTRATCGLIVGPAGIGAGQGLE